MTREENLHWIDEEIRTWENECQSKYPIKEAFYAARKALEQEQDKPMVEIDLYSVIKQKYIERDVIDKIIADIIDEKDFAYVDFVRYKEEVLGDESDELPDDDFRYGMERAIEIIYKHKTESEGKE